MFKLIEINIDKKLSFTSMFFMFISILLIYVLAIYYASFELSDFKTLDQNYIILENYILETFQLIELIGIIFIIILIELELVYNTDNFDSYFIALKGKKNVFVSKIIGYLIILIFYNTLIFMGVLIIYFIRFKSVKLLSFIINSYFIYLIYFTMFLFITYLFMLFFKNYFIAIVIFIYYWLCRIIETENKFFNILCHKIEVDLFNYNISFSINIYYIIIYILILIMFCGKLYEVKDLKINS